MMHSEPADDKPSAQGPNLTFERSGGERVLTSITTGSALVRNLNK
jgi:hypothetical protein